MSSLEVASLDLPLIEARPRFRGLGSRTRVLLVQAAVFLVLIALWQAGASLNIINGNLFGSPAGIVTAFEHAVVAGSLWSDTGITVLETVYGFLAGTILGTTLGLALWYSRFLAQVVEPIAVAFNGVPKIALGPMIIIWIGAGIASKIVLAFVSTFVVALLAAYAASREIDPDLITLLRSFGASRGHIFRKLLVPGSLPLIFATMRINVGFALVGAVVGEFISSQYGLGHAIFVAGNLFDLNTVWLGVIVLSLVAGVMLAIVDAGERLIVKGRS